MPRRNKKASKSKTLNARDRGVKRKGNWKAAREVLESREDVKHPTQ